MMEENDNRSLEEKFLDEFKELEVYIVAKCNLKDEFISFSRALTNPSLGINTRKFRLFK